MLLKNQAMERVGSMLMHPCFDEWFDLLICSMHVASFMPQPVGRK
jgi:hypothetical protein